MLAVCVGHPETLPGKRHKTGINKHPVGKPLALGFEGLEGDAVCDRRYHGGPDQAVYVEGGISLSRWTEDLGRPIEHGEFGENVIIDKLDNEVVAVGDRLLVGDVILEVTAPRMPCATFAAKMREPQFVNRYRKAQRPGFYCRVIKPGQLQAVMDTEVIVYKGSRITMPGLRVSADPSQASSFIGDGQGQILNLSNAVSLRVGGSASGHRQISDLRYSSSSSSRSSSNSTHQDLGRPSLPSAQRYPRAFRRSFMSNGLPSAKMRTRDLWLA